MATVQTLINRAGRMLSVVASNTAMGTDESADALVAVNALLDSWRVDKCMAYAHQEESLTLSNGTTSYTIGPGGTLSTTRPVAIDAAWIVVSNISYAVEMIDDDQYASLQDKTATADWPTKANYKASMSTGTLYVYPVPNATRTMKLLTRVVVAAYSAVTDTVTLPPGWELALTSNLAVALAPEYEKQVSPEVQKIARDSLAAIKRINGVPLKAYTELPALVSRATHHILTDQ